MFIRTKKTSIFVRFDYGSLGASIYWFRADENYDPGNATNFILVANNAGDELIIK